MIVKFTRNKLTQQGCPVAGNEKKTKQKKHGDHVSVLKYFRPSATMVKPTLGLRYIGKARNVTNVKGAYLY